MHSIFIADDEAIIREGIQCLLDYEALGYRICGEAATGDQALEKLLTLQPDVALMDIRMPGISGLEAIRRARQQGYTGKVVIVSSYTDFKYAQEAIRYGVQHYLTKPIDEDELKRILEEFSLSFAREEQDSHSSAQYREKVRSAMIADILLGSSQPDQQQLAELQLAADRYQVVLLERPKASEESPPLTGSDSKDYDHILLEGSEVLLLRGSAAIRRFHELLDFSLRSRHGADPFPFFACGPEVTAAQDISESYRQAVRLQERRFFCDPEQYVLTPGDLPEATDCTPTVSNQLVKKYAATLLDCIQSFNRRSMVQTLQELHDLLWSTSDPIRSIRLYLMDLYLQIREQMSQLYPESEIPFFTNAEIIHTIEEASYLYEIIQFFSQRFEIFMEATGTSTRDSVLDDILHYIHHNYAGNITLESIAPLFGYNRSYLGKIFTKKMGQNFNSYVDHVRIEKSKELLLKDNAKVYIIAERVGYKNVDYFHLKFRKYVGQSPAEYRKQNKRP